MLRVSSSGPKGNKQGYVKVYRDSKMIVFLECNYFSPYQYAIKHPMGWFAKAIRQMMLNAGCNHMQCDYILKVGKFDPRNKGVRYLRPEQFLSQIRSENAKAYFARRREVNAHDSSDL
ncbi:hypothetical protein [Vibrio owensii]|uniref:hypothetical protein n=1 Tax=Vibrio owensii TaxID=696485 RepID=UPI0038CE7790